MKKFLLLVVVLASFAYHPQPVFAQDTGTAQVKDSTVVTTPTSTPSTTNWLKDNYVAILIFIVGLYELLARLVPTVKNISILSLIIAIITKIIPNNKAPDPTASSNPVASFKAPRSKTHEIVTS